MVCLSTKATWQRIRALKLHEHFKALEIALQGRGGKLSRELGKIARMLDGKEFAIGDGETWLMKASESTLEREWYYWLKGGRDGQERPEHVRQPEALLPAYKPGNGGHRAMPAKLVQEIQRRITHCTGARDKHKKSPISSVYDRLCEDFKERKPITGIDYSLYPMGAEFPWCYETVNRMKPGRNLRLLGNVGASAHKSASAYVSLNYSKLRKGELYTLDDVRLDIVAIDEMTGKRTELVCYILMEVGSRMIVAFVMRPAGAIKQEDVDELIAYGLQTPGFGIGVGYATHILFERGATACSEAAQMVMEGVTNGGIKVHRTSMNTGVRWVGSPRDKSIGNAAGKAVIESFHRGLHYSLLHLPGQRGNKWEHAPENLGYDGPDRTHKGSLVDEAERLAGWNLAMGGRLRLSLPMLYVRQVRAAVTESIKRHNTEPGHAYRGHGEFAQAEVQPGVWETAEVGSGKCEVESEDGQPEAAEVEAAPLPTSHSPLPTSPRQYTLHTAPVKQFTGAQKNAIYWKTWAELQKAKPGLNRFSLVAKTIGKAKAANVMTDEEFAKVLSVFKAIIRDAQPAPVSATVDYPF